MAAIRWRRAAAFFGLACASLLALVLAWLNQTESREQREIPREWARLADYPESARDLRTSTSGGAFTRAFRVSFSAPPADVERWLQASPGTRDTKPDIPSPGKRHFAIRPGGGVQHAEVTVDDASGAVSIYVYWS